MSVKSAARQRGAPSLGSTVVASRGQVSCVLAGENMLPSRRTHVYHGLDVAGERVWTLVAGSATVAAISRTRVGEYADVKSVRWAREVLALLEQLAERELLDVVETRAE